MKPKTVDYKHAFHKSNLLQQGIKRATKAAISEHSVPDEDLFLLDETASYWIIKVFSVEFDGESLHLIWKDTLEITSLAIHRQV